MWNRVVHSVYFGVVPENDMCCFGETKGGPFKKAQAIHLYAKQTFVLI